jgi:hypothetical protein
MQNVKSLQERIRGFAYSAAPMEQLIPIFCDIQELAKSVGLLALSFEIEFIDDRALARSLARIIDGCETAEVAATALEHCSSLDAPPMQQRELFIACFCVLLQDALPRLEQRLREFLRQKNPAASIVRLLGELHMPHTHRLRTRLRESPVSKTRYLDIIDRDAPWDALAYYGAGLEAVALVGLDASFNVLSSVHAMRFHPFAWAFQDYLESSEPDHSKPADLLGVLRFGFLASPDMPACYRLLAAAHERRRAGPFATFLLGMLHLYHLEDLPYLPERALRLVSEAAAAGLPIAVAWGSRFYLETRPPFFPTEAIPRRIQGSEALSQDEIGELLLAISPGEKGDRAPWRDEERRYRMVDEAAVSWDWFVLHEKAGRSLARGDVQTCWTCLERGVVLNEPWARATIAAALASVPGGLLRACPSRVAGLRDFALGGTAWRPTLLLAVHDSLCTEYLKSVAQMLITGEGLPRDQELGERIIAELSSRKAGRGASGEMTQEEIDQLLKTDTDDTPVG